MSYHHPQTPQSPSQPSPGISDLLPSMTSSMTSITSALPTPAHSVNGSTSLPSDMPHDVIMGDDTPQKRKRSISDIGGRDEKKIHLEEPQIGDLHLDLGPKYLVCETPIQMPKYNTSNDLFETFNLTELATKMAREKPNGEKNALRKSFKSQVKELNIDGAYDTKKDERDEYDPEGFFAMLNLPDDVWYAHHVKGKEIRDGLSESTKPIVPKAMTMAKGKIRKEHWDPYMLGPLETTSAAGPSAQAGDGSTQPGSAKATAPNTPAVSTPSAMMARTKAGAGGGSQTLAPGQHDPSRPRRSVKKRSYGDSSFEGYGEGFPDDDAGVDTGYSTGDGDDRAGHKRRKKNPSGNASQSFPPMRQQSYGPGMVGA